MFAQEIQPGREQALLLTIPCMRSIKQLYSSVASTKLDIDYKDKINTFRSTWTEMVEGLTKAEYNISTPPKVHIIIDHLGDYLDLTGKSLAYTSDQHIEATHQRIHRIERNSGYSRKRKSGMKASLALIGKTRHANSYNVLNYPKRKKECQNRIE